MTDQQERISYCIDGRDNLVSLNRAWDSFAIANEAPELVSDKVLGRSLWDFVSGDAIRHVYNHILRRVRGGETLEFDFRCDAPDLRRFLNIHTDLTGNGSVQFETRTIRLEPRPAQSVFMKHSEFTEEIVVACSWCKKIRIHDDTWKEVEHAIGILDLFESSAVPQLSHGMCEACYQSALERIQNR